MIKKPKIDYVYILAASHSGSTLLAMLLNAHPCLGTIGEASPTVSGADTYLCSCRRLLKDCPFWRNVSRRMQKDHPDFDLGHFGTKFELSSSSILNRVLRMEHRGVLFERARDMVLGLSPGWRRLRRAISARCYDLASAVLAESKASVFVDSSKLAHRLKFVLGIPEFNVKVIHLVRDGRAVALTYMRQDEFADAKDAALRRGGRGMRSAATAISLPIEKAADEWRRCLVSAEHALAGLERSQWHRVHYEDLCNDTEVTLREVFDFLAVDCEAIAADFRTVENHVIGNGMRLDSTAEVRLDERWRDVLTAEDLQVFEQVAGETNRRYGYE